jgi:hypothetical protein
MGGATGPGDGVMAETTSADTAVTRRLVVVGYQLTRAGHWYNELLGYAAAAKELGWSISILVPTTVDQHLAQTIPVKRALDQLTELPAPGDFEKDPALVVDRMSELNSLWRALDEVRPGKHDLILFVHADPRLLVGIGTWLSRRAVDSRPNVFFRFLGYELLDPVTMQSLPTVRLYASAARALTQLDWDKVHLLVNSPIAMQALAATTMRRAFDMPLPKYLPPATARKERRPSQRKLIYLRLNPSSGSLLNEVNDLLRLILQEVPEAFFVFKFAWRSAPTSFAIAPDLVDHIRVAPVEQTVDEYFHDIAQADIVALIYQPEPYRTLTSGVVAEAAAYAKPLVGPANTWIAEQIAGGYVAGHAFERPSARSIAFTLLKALAELPRLQAAARAIAETAQSHYSSRSYLERMCELAESNEDMRLRYGLGESIDFSSSIASRYILGDGWAETESWGVWTQEETALIRFAPQTVPDAGLAINALVVPFLPKIKPHLTVAVTVKGQKIARWDFNRRERNSGEGVWRQARIPRPLCEYGEQCEICITLTMSPIDSPRSLGLSSDDRKLGLGLRRLSLS